MLINDPDVAKLLRLERQASGVGRFDEVWDGVYVVSLIASYEHQWIAAEILVALHSVLPLVGGGRVMNGVNVSDRRVGWKKNFRVPDLAVVLDSNPGKVCKAHFFGGPDLVVEIVSPDDLTRMKLPFYSKLGVREFFVLDRDPWSLELYTLDGGQLIFAGRSKQTGNEVLESGVLPLSFRITSGADNSRLEIARLDTSQHWLI